MKKKLTIAFLCIAFTLLLAISVMAAAPAPAKPELDVAFGDVSTIDGFTPPSQLYVNTTERVLLTDGNGNYVTYPTYYITKDSTTFNVDFSKLNGATGITYSKASIAMLEIPNGVTTISNKTFSGTSYTVCQYVQFPGSITTFGDNVFETNKACKIVEFVDGTTPLTIGNSAFCGNWQGGPVIEYVKFPNNLVSLGKNTFGKAFNLKTVVLGENIETIGTGFFGECFSSGDKYIYAGKNLIKNTDGMFAEFFGSLGQYNNKKLNIVLYTDCSEEEAKAFVAAGKALKSDYIFADDRVSYYDASTYNYETNNYANTWGKLIIVYGMNKCDAFYNGIHKYDESNPCVKACINCGLGTKAHNDTKAELVSITYANGYSNEGEKHITCSNKGCILDVTEKAKPLFETKGYSTPENGRGDIVIGFVINYDEIAEYEKSAGVTLTYGAFAVAYDKIGTDSILDSQNAITVEIEDDKYASFEMRISGFETDAHKEAKLSIGAYVIDSKGDVSYLQAAEANEGESYHYITYNDIYTNTEQ